MRLFWKTPRPVSQHSRPVSNSERIPSQRRLTQHRPFKKKNDAKSCKIQRNYWYLEQIMQIKPSSIFFVFFWNKKLLHVILISSTWCTECFKSDGGENFPIDIFVLQHVFRQNHEKKSNFHRNSLQMTHWMFLKAIADTIYKLLKHINICFFSENKFWSFNMNWYHYISFFCWFQYVA